MNDLVKADSKDDCSELRQAAFELGITLEALSAGLEALARSPASNVKDELSVLVRFSQEAGADIDTIVRLLNKQI